MPYIIVPQEHRRLMQTVIHEAFHETNGRIYDTTAIESGSCPHVTYTDAINELKLWRQTNLWSAAPLCIESNHTTQELVDYFDRAKREPQYRHI